MLTLLVLSPLLAPQAVEATHAAALRLEEAALVGTWEGVFHEPGFGPEELRLALWPAGEGAFAGGLRAGEDTALVSARIDREAGRLVLEALTVGELLTGELLPTEVGLGGTLTVDPGVATLRAERISTEIADDLLLEVDLTVERPLTIDRDGLPDFLEEALMPLVHEFVQNERVVGVSLAVILDFEVADLRSVGWQDFARRIPATAKTRYRWASISKPVTAVAALQLVEQGELDLDRDVRELVPELPEKQWRVTARDLLRHQAGIVHYQHDPIRTEREYDDPDPFRSRILALDMFKESPLIFEPGTQYSYSTHGYALLGAVIERAGKQRFSEQVHARIVRPLGMTTMQPDFHHSVAIPDQTVGYRTVGDERTMDSGDSNVAWKLAGGGFLSNIDDLALFGIGLMTDTLLSEESRAAMQTPQETADGAETTYGLGVSMARWNTPAGEVLTVGHNGSQRKTRTFLRVVPELGIGVALMCNTEGVDIDRAGTELLRALLE